MKKKIVLTLLLPIQILIVNVLAFFPEFIEKYYSNAFFPHIAKASRLFFGLFGVSIGDIIYGIVIISIIRWLWKRRKTWKTEYKFNLFSITAFLSVFYFLFNFLWALNYHREPLNEKMGFKKKYTQDELIAFTHRVIKKANEAHLKITKDSAVMVTNPYSVREIYDLSINGYNNLAQQYPYFKYEYECIKSSLISLPLSYMGFGGYLNPFTNEAQVNSLLPKYNLPTTSCHEMSHQIGYASESEANFIGYMASISNEDLYFQYSGYTMALKYCLRNIEKLEKGKSERFLPLINKGILLNFEESEQFNKKYDSFIESFFEYFYDNFLKFNKQKDGLEGYSKFVGLLVNYYKDKNL